MLRKWLNTLLQPSIQRFKFATDTLLCSEWSSSPSQLVSSNNLWRSHSRKCFMWYTVVYVRKLLGIYMYACASVESLDFLECSCVGVIVNGMRISIWRTLFELSLWTMCFANELRMREWVGLYPWTYAARWRCCFNTALGRVSNSC